VAPKPARDNSVPALVLDVGDYPILLDDRGMAWRP
jgi:hypothetical protein